MKRQLTLLTAAMAFASIAQAQLVNGSFELPDVDPSQKFGAGANIGGWTVGGASLTDSVILIDSIGGNAFPNPPAMQASDGAQWLDLTGDGDAANPGGTYGGSVSQAINNLVAGSAYSVSFDVGSLHQHIAAIALQINGALVPQVFTSPTSGSEWDNNWTSYSVPFIAAAGANTITFTGMNLFGAQALSIGLDNVQVVPEPQAYALALVGLGVVGLLGRRRKTSR